MSSGLLMELRKSGHLKKSWIYSASILVCITTLLIQGASPPKEGIGSVSYVLFFVSAHKNGHLNAGNFPRFIGDRCYRRRLLLAERVAGRSLKHTVITNPHDTNSPLSLTNLPQGSRLGANGGRAAAILNDGTVWPSPPVARKPLRALLPTATMSVIRKRSRLEVSRLSARRLHSCPQLQTFSVRNRYGCCVTVRPRFSACSSKRPRRHPPYFSAYGLDAEHGTLVTSAARQCLEVAGVELDHLCSPNMLCNGLKQSCVAVGWNMGSR